MKRWQFWIDVGGTFTDCVAESPQGELFEWKTLSSGRVKGSGTLDPSGCVVTDPLRAGDPENFWVGWKLLPSSAQDTAPSPIKVVGSTSEGALRLESPLPTQGSPLPYELVCEESAPLVCIRRLLKLRLDESIPDVDVRMGTTRGTNALLERQGAKTAFLVTRGFGDTLQIGNQDRPELFALTIRKPAPLAQVVVEIDERMRADGTVLTPLNQELTREQLRVLKESGVRSLAICLLHAYRNPEHEEGVAQLALELGFEEVSCSSCVAPLIKIVPRAETTVLDAYLTPVLRSYLNDIRSRLGPDSSLKLMCSHGGLVDARDFSGKDSILSGPAGGVIAYSSIARQAGFENSIGFDMGGTSTDVSRFGGKLELETESVKAGVRIASPVLAIETVAAGGGSICQFDGVQLRVGPESAGADPGPACYGRGGPLTVTDLNLVLGRLLPEHFPFPLDRDAVHQRLDELRREIAASESKRVYSREELAQGFIDIANETMAGAMRQISVRKGYDPSSHVLVCFGGAGAQHACALARMLNIGAILIHPQAGLLSAFGMGLADLRRRAEVSVLETIDPQTCQRLEPQFRELEERLTKEILSEGISPDRIDSPSRTVNVRYVGVESTIRVPFLENSDELRESFEKHHRQLYGYVHSGRPFEIVSLETEVVGHLRHVQSPELPPADRPLIPHATTTTWCHGEALLTNVYLREQLRSGHTLSGPAILCDAGSTIWIEPGFEAVVRPTGELLITRNSGKAASAPSEVSAMQSESEEELDPVTLELFNNRFASIAEQMGQTLRKTSISTNVKERLDYSCALFDADGGLVVNAPHIPVHLGAMGETVRCLLRDHPRMQPGDVFLTNDPYAGGSHLPDLTLVTPVHDPHSGELLFLTASRAHHAEIGGITPGSMPPFSRTLGEEGVLISNFKLASGGQSRLEQLRELLVSSPWPSRKPDDNLADVTAQMAANQIGVQLLLELVEQHSRKRVQQAMRGIQAAAELKMRRALQSIPDGTYARTDWLDDGSPIAVRIDITGETARLDFHGTGPVLETNLNANRAIVTAAVMYVFRCLIDEPIPLNSGVLRPVEIILPECLLNPPLQAERDRCAAMVGGNVETSQRVVDVLLGALKLAADSQGTMNNFTFGDTTFGYYETICGGAGATAAGPGADAVQTNMTNTRLTDAEVFETRYPVRIIEFSVRANSGGKGKKRGGDGVRRIFEFDRTLQVSLLTQRRGPYPPLGLNGGEAGALGRNQLFRSGASEWEVLPGAVLVEVHPGDRLKIETPGGGGWGAPSGVS